MQRILIKKQILEIVHDNKNIVSKIAEEQRKRAKKKYKTTGISKVILTGATTLFRKHPTVRFSFKTVNNESVFLVNLRIFFSIKYWK